MSVEMEPTEAQNGIDSPSENGLKKKRRNMFDIGPEGMWDAV